MKILLLTSLPNRVADTLFNLLGENLYTLDIIKIENKKATIVRTINDYNPDLLVTYRCPYILSIDILQMFPYGAYNIHPSLLPKYKGLNPWIEIFQNHESESGVTLHRITKDIDSGPIILQDTFKIALSDTVESARENADILAAKIISSFISNSKSKIFPSYSLQY